MTRAAINHIVIVAMHRVYADYSGASSSPLARNNYNVREELFRCPTTRARRGPQNASKVNVHDDTKWNIGAKTPRDPRSASGRSVEVGTSATKVEEELKRR